MPAVGSCYLEVLSRTSSQHQLLEVLTVDGQQLNVDVKRMCESVTCSVNMTDVNDVVLIDAADARLANCNMLCLLQLTGVLISRCRLL